MNEFILAIIVIFIPGILAAVICDKVTFHHKWDSFKFSLYAFLLGVFSYLFVQLCFSAADVFRWLWSDSLTWRQLAVWKALVFDRKLLSLDEIIYATFAAIPVAFIASWAINFRIFNKLGWYFGISTKYGDDNLFSYQLNDLEFSWVYIRDFKNNLTYMGQICSYSETVGLQEIVLRKVEIFRYEDSAHLYNSPYIYLSIVPGSIVIEAISPDNLEKIDG